VSLDYLLAFVIKYRTLSYAESCTRGIVIKLMSVLPCFLG